MKHHVRLFMLFALVAAGIGESTATPLLTPYVVKSSIIYEGGYAMNLRVCGNVLCGLNVSTPQRRLQVPKKKLADIVDPDLGAAVMFVDMATKTSGVITIEIPYSDFDRRFHPGKRVYIVEIRDGVFRGVSTQERGVREGGNSVFCPGINDPRGIRTTPMTFGLSMRHRRRYAGGPSERSVVAWQRSHCIPNVFSCVRRAWKTSTPGRRSPPTPRPCAISAGCRAVRRPGAR